MEIHSPALSGDAPGFPSYLGTITTRAARPPRMKGNTMRSILNMILGLDNTMSGVPVTTMELGGHALTDETTAWTHASTTRLRSNSGGNPNNNQPSGKTAHGKAMKPGIQMIVRNASRDAHAAHLHARVADEMEDQHSNEP